MKGDGEVGGDREERNRVLGFPVSGHPNRRPAGRPQHPSQAPRPQRRPQAEEPQRVLGIPADWFEPFLDDVLRPLLRRLRGSRD